MKNKDVLEIVDTLASEYSWTIPDILELPIDVISNLYKLIASRKKREYSIMTKLIGMACACAFNGKLEKLDSIFPEEVDTENPEKSSEQLINQLRQLWTMSGKPLAEFDKKLKTGDVRF
ncbi:hypothetical protein LCGC14_0306060 [marine sediment metagenome]|uniref:Uncharacterized protein n=1 Tax=marine sediment metagenome TaxID=412755 RepID=A0A0F9U679_9ZZZZ